MVPGSAVPVRPRDPAASVEATFARRETKLPPPPEPFTDAFVNDPTKQSQWAAFLRRNRLTGITNQFSEVVAIIRQFIDRVLRPNASPPP